jgi:hypothetical protein
MDAWGWILVYAAGLVVLQVLVYRYLWRRSGPIGSDESGRWRAGGRDRGGDLYVRGGRDGDGNGDGEGGSGSGADPSRGVDGEPGEGGRRHGAPAAGREWLATGGRGSDADEPSSRRCSHCGAENEPDRTFDRCWNCAERLT